jgi:Domain of unknown function (DUF4440)
MISKIGFGALALLLAVGLYTQWARAEDCGASTPMPSDAEVAAELRANTQAMLDAIAPGDASIWNRLLDDAAIQIDENNIVRNKAQILAEFKPLPAGLVGHLKVDDFRMVRRDRVAVVTHEDDEYLDYHGQIIRSRFRMTDTWVQHPDGWRELGSQVLAVLKDPPAQRLPANILCQYAGRYRMTPAIVGSLRCRGDELIFTQTGRPDRYFRAELTDVFFEPGAPRTRRIFSRDAAGRITGFADRREARDIVWKRQQD